MSLTAEQVRMRDNLSNKKYWVERWEEDADSVCADLMALYTVTGEETREMIVTMIQEQSLEFRQLLSEMKQSVDKDREILERLAHNDRRQDARLDKLEHQGVNTAIKLDHVETYTKQIPALADAINKLHDTVNIALQQSTSQPKPTASPQAKPKLSTILASIPTAGYLVGGVVSIALISAATGHLGEFFAWLGSAKILGGVK